MPRIIDQTGSNKLVLFKSEDKKINNDNKWIKKNDNDNLRNKYFCKWGQMMQFSSQPIKYERIKLGNRKDKKTLLE